MVPKFVSRAGRTRVMATMQRRHDEEVPKHVFAPPRHVDVTVLDEIREGEQHLEHEDRGGGRAEQDDRAEPDGQRWQRTYGRLEAPETLRLTDPVGQI